MSQKPALPKYVSIERLKPPKKRLRSDEADLDDLLESFEHSPVLHDPVVRAVAGTKDFEIIAGFRRVEALRKRGVKQVLVKVIEATDEEAFIWSLEENERRKPLPKNVDALATLKAHWEESATTKHGGDRRSANFKGSAEKNRSATTIVAKTTNRSPRSVRRAEGIARKAVPAVKKAWSAGTISLADAEKLAALDPAEQVNGLSKVLADKEARRRAPTVFRCLNAADYLPRALASSEAQFTLVDLERLRRMLSDALKRVDALIASRRTS